MTRPVLCARDLSVGYGTVPVVHNLDLHVDPGEVIALMGANGAGKSTTLKALVGLIKPSNGAVIYDGKAAAGPLHRRARSGCRYVPEQRSVIRSLTTRENLRLGLGPVDEALELFPELVPLLDRPAGLLSGGEQQIVALARALSGDVRTLIADELSLGLAPMIVERLLEAVRHAASHRGVGVILVEQHANIALRHVDRAYVLNGGRLVLEGSAESLRGRVGEIEETYLQGMSP